MLGHQIVLTVVSFLFYAVAFADSVSNVTIRTRAENNRNASVWYRVPENYREISGRKWRALDSVRRRFALKNRPVILYGYSAGGQCAALFSEFMKDEVAAWGVHGCGVFPLRDETLSTPVLVTCGEDDSVRFGISRQFAYRRRDAGGFVLWRGFANGHELNQDALKLADAWLSAFAGETPSVRSWGEDDTQRILPVSRIEREFRNPLYTRAIERIWRQ